ncbi:hypothetical protein D3C80_1538260 [compost metagenome]
MVGRFVQQQHVRFFQQQAAQRDTATFTTGQVGDFCVPFRQAQRIGGALKLGIQVVAIMGLNDFFQTALFSGQLVEVRAFFSVQRVHFIKTFQGTDHFRQRFFDRLADGVLQIQLRLLRQVADFDPLLRASFTFDIGIDAGHDAQQSGFTRAVQTQHADFGAREEAQ